jgi:hypothetical protein
MISEAARTCSPVCQNGGTCITYGAYCQFGIPATGAGGCAAGELSSEGGCYFKAGTNLDWWGAWQACLDKGGKLASDRYDCSYKALVGLLLLLLLSYTQMVWANASNIGPFWTSYYGWGHYSILTPWWCTYDAYALIEHLDATTFSPVGGAYACTIDASKYGTAPTVCIICNELIHKHIL